MLRHSLLVGYHIEHECDKINHVYHKLLVLGGKRETSHYVTKEVIVG